MKRITQKAALERIERETRGFDWLSREGWIHAFAASALGLPLSEGDAKVLREQEERKKYA